MAVVNNALVAAICLDYIKKVDKNLANVFQTKAKAVSSVIACSTTATTSTCHYTLTANWR